MRLIKRLWFYLRTTRQQREFASMIAKDIAELPITIVHDREGMADGFPTDPAELLRLWHCQAHGQAWSLPPMEQTQWFGECISCGRVHVFTRELKSAILYLTNPKRGIFKP